MNFHLHLPPCLSVRPFQAKLPLPSLAGNLPDKTFRFLYRIIVFLLKCTYCPKEIKNGPHVMHLYRMMREPSKKFQPKHRGIGHFMPGGELYHRLAGRKKAAFQQP
jgi:hypothetical protein